MFCGYSVAAGNRTNSVILSTRNEGGFRQTTVLTESEIGQSIVQFENDRRASGLLACNSEGLVWVVSFDLFGRTTIWQAKAGELPRVLLAPGSSLDMGKQHLTFQRADRLLVMNDALVVIGSFNGRIQAVQIGATEIHVRAHYGNEPVLDACATASSLFALTANGQTSVALRQNPVTLSAIARQQTIGIVSDIRSVDSYSLGCSADRAALLFRENGGLSLVRIVPDYGVSRQVLGVMLNGFAASDIWDVSLTSDGTPIFAMLIDGFSSVALQVKNNGTTETMLSFNDPVSIGLLRLGNDVYWYEDSRHTGGQ